MTGLRFREAYGPTTFKAGKASHDLWCTKCKSKPRTRMLALALLRACSGIGGLPIVHFAPEKQLCKLLAKRFGESYELADINPEAYRAVGPVRRVDLSEPSRYFGPNSVAGFIHSHVLEHIPAPLDVVLPQMNEAVAPGGFHAFVVPIKKGDFEEDLSALTPEQRNLRFGHPGHMRTFGTRDWENRVLRHFVGWERVDLSSLIDDEDLMAHGIPPIAVKALTGTSAHVFVKRGAGAENYRFPRWKDAWWNSYEGQKARYEVIRPYLGTDAVGAEIGVYKGGFGEFLLPHCRKLYLVDPWYRASAYWKRSGIRADSRVDAVIDILKLYKEEIHAGKVEVVVDYSFNFLPTVDDRSFDFVYIDSSHSYERTRQELNLVLPKMKPGGIILGDDYVPNPKSRLYGVYRAVQEFVASGVAAELLFVKRHQWGLRVAV